MTVYVGARDLSGVPLGTHQFIVITYPSQTAITIGGFGYVTQILGKGIHGFVIGAQNRKTLKAEMFEQADTEAAKEHFGAKPKKWYKSDYSAELRLVKFKGNNFSLHAEREIIRLVDVYMTNQKLDPIKYPTAGFGFNSNSWVQSIIEYSGGKIDGGGNMKGLDINNRRRIPKTYFIPYCPEKPRIKING